MTLDLTTATRPGIPEAEAGNRTQLEEKCIFHTGVKGVLTVKQNLQKLMDFLGHFKVQSDGEFRSVPSEGNFKAFCAKVKSIINNSNDGVKVKAEKIALLVRGTRWATKFS